MRKSVSWQIDKQIFCSGGKQHVGKNKREAWKRSGNSVRAFIDGHNHSCFDAGMRTLHFLTHLFLGGGDYGAADWLDGSRRSSFHVAETRASFCKCD